MKNTLFVVKDKFEGIITTCLSRSVAHCIRTIVPAVVSKYPLKDCELFSIAELDMDSGELTDIRLEKHSWNEYNFPANKGEALAPLGSDVVKAFEDKTKKDGEDEC